jgi:hypothetical protein
MSDYKLPDRWADDLDYRARISLIAGIVWARADAHRKGMKPGHGILTHADLVEYRAHLVLERLGGTLSEHLIDQSIEAADAAEKTIWPYNS